jgi:hypothetical protein
MAGDGKMACSIAKMKIEIPTTMTMDVPSLRSR